MWPRGSVGTSYMPELHANAFLCPRRIKLLVEDAFMVGFADSPYHMCTGNSPPRTLPVPLRVLHTVCAYAIPNYAKLFVTIVVLLHYCFFHGDNDVPSH